MRIVKIIFGLIVIAIGVTFAWMNATTVAFNYYFGEAKLSLSLLLVIALGLGIILGASITGLRLLKIKYQHAKLKSRVKHAEQEIKNLRSIPIEDSH